MKTQPRLVIERTVIFEVPADVAVTLYEMFNYSNIDKIYAEHVTKYAISAEEIRRATTGLKEAISPLLRAIRTVDDVVKSVHAEFKR